MLNSRRSANNRILKVLITLILVFMGHACTTEKNRECERYADFFRLSLSERENELPRLPVEQQVDACICGMDREPPAINLCYTLAESAQSAVPILVERLKTSNDERRQRDIVRILSVLSREGKLREREDIISEIERVVDKMKHQALRDTSQTALAEIKTNVRRLSEH